MAAIVNPLVSENCPDPSVLRADAGFYACCTSNLNDDGDKFPIRRSNDLVRWEKAGHVFPRGKWPTWARRDFWAPEIHRVGSGYVVHFTARDADGMLCLGAARAERPEGPWSDLGRPLLRDPLVGMIDSHLFQDDDGRRYLYWKSDGNGLKPPQPSEIFVQPVADDGVTLTQSRVTLMTNDRAWEGDVVEGPWVVRRADRYFLFYAGNTFNSPRYSTGVARASSPLGPFSKHEKPILVSNDRWQGPGHGCVVPLGGGEDVFVYHAWEAGKIDEVWDQSVHPRMMLVDRILWQDGWPRIGGGTPATGAIELPRSR